MQENKFTKESVSFQGYNNVTKLTNQETGKVSYLTQASSFRSLGRELESDGLAIDHTTHCLAMFHGSERVNTLYMCKKIHDLDVKDLQENLDDLKVFESWNADEEHWVPCLTLMKDKLEEQKKAFSF
jgi:hypothetical protein